MGKRVGLFMLLTVAVAFSSTAAHGSLTIDTYPYWDGNITRGWNAAAQSFTAPADEPLNSWQFTLAPRSGGGTVNFSIYDWTASGPVGTALFSQNESWPVAGGNVLVSGINLALVPGKLYGAEIDLLGYSGSSVNFMYNQTGYSGGNGFWDEYSGSWYNLAGTNLEFSAVFGSSSSVPEPSTLIVWSLLGTLAIGLGWWRKRKAA